MEDKELFDILDKGAFAEKFIYGKDGEIFKECAGRIVEAAIYQLCYKIDLDHTPSVIRMIERIKLNKYELFKDLKLLIQDGEVAFDELKLRNRLDVPLTSSVDCT